MHKRCFLICLMITLLLSGCETIQDWLPGGNSRPTATIVQQTPPIPDSASGTAAAGQTDQTALPVPKELKTTATAIASDSITRVASAPEASELLYKLQAGTPASIANFSHPDKGCNWMGVGGQVFNTHSEPVLFLVVEAGGSLNGASISALSLTGSATAWGPGGFEIKLSDRPIESSGTIWVQFYDLGGKPVSEKIYITTYKDCNQNAILVNLVQPKAPGLLYYFPFVGKNTNETP